MCAKSDHLGIVEEHLDSGVCYRTACPSQMMMNELLALLQIQCVCTERQVPTRSFIFRGRGGWFVARAVCVHGIGILYK